LPDLLPGFTKIFNKNLRISSLELNKKERDIHHGIFTHFQDDKLFHSNLTFENFCKELTSILAAKQPDRNALRLSFIAHLLVEMLFDRWLCETNPTLPDKFYAMLENVCMKDVEQYFMKHKLQDKFNLVEQKRQRFLTHRFLYELNESEHLAFGVGKIYDQTTGKTITNSEQFRIIDSTNEFYAQNREWKALLIR